MEKFAMEMQSGNAQLDSSDEKARDLLWVLDASSIVAFTDVAGNITYVNDKFCEISQYSREELIGKNHRIVNSGKHSPEFWGHFWKMISTGHIWKGEIRNQAKDGSHYWLFTTVVPLFDKSGKPKQYISIRYEITEKKKLEVDGYQSQVQVEKLKTVQDSIEKFVSMLAHDLRTPLTAAKMSAGLILRQSGINAKVAEYAKKVINGLDQVDEMISHLLDANKIRIGEAVPIEITDCDLGKEISLTLEVLSTIYGERFKFNVNGSLSGHWDKAGLRSITENLCSNAIKYGSAKKPVVVELKGDEAEISLSVYNDGALLSDDDQKSIFQYMRRSSSAHSNLNGGWGIGLAKVREVAEANGGIVEVESSADAGTKFVVRLPRNPATSGTHVSARNIELRKCDRSFFQSGNGQIPH